MPQDGEVLSRIASTDAALILVEGDVAHPVAPGLDPPVSLLDDLALVMMDPGHPSASPTSKLSWTSSCRVP